MDPYRIDTVKYLKASGIQPQQATAGGGSPSQVTDLISLPNGAIITCSADRSITLWEEKKGNAACAACCTLF